MKTLLFLTLLVFCATQIFGQNYIGMNQNKIIKKFGKPDERGTNYIIYYDQAEGGINTYYFDEKEKCNAFVLTRETNYFNEYKKILAQDFEKTSESMYVHKSKTRNFKAEITRTEQNFEIKITPIEEGILSCIN